jgi:hypothetical protein
MRSKRMIIIAIGVVCCLLLFGCSTGQQSEPAREVCDPGVLNLLLTEDAFPGQWGTEYTLRPDTHRNATHRCSRGFSARETGAFEDIYEYDSVSDAIREYERLETPPARGVWVPAPFIARVELSADDFSLSCYPEGQECRLTARYGTFVVYFGARVSPPGHHMTEDDFISILQVIDDTMTQSGITESE